MKSVLLPPTTFHFPQTELGFQIAFNSLNILPTYHGQRARILKTLLSYRRTVEYQRISFTYAQKTRISNCET